MGKFPYQISPQYERFNQRYVIFSRWEWDEREAGLGGGMVENLALYDKAGRGEFVSSERFNYNAAALDFL